MQLRILMRPEHSLAKFSDKISNRKLRIKNGRLQQNSLAIANATSWCTQILMCIFSMSMVRGQLSEAGENTRKASPKRGPPKSHEEATSLRLVPDSTRAMT